MSNSSFSICSLVYEYLISKPKKFTILFLIFIFRLSAKGTDGVMKPGGLLLCKSVCYTLGVGLSKLQNPRR